jgi:glutathione synthase/RimK-type ligase-like ATP-grasp enzyme
MKVKNYVYAGLDFVFDGDEKPWFIEANGVPRTMYEFKQVYGNSLPIKKLAEKLDKIKGEKCIISDRGQRFRKNVENSLWMAKELNRFLEKPISICNYEDNLSKKNKLMDINGRFFKPSVIITWKHKIPKGISSDTCLIINSRKAAILVKDKIKTIEIIKKRTNVRVPATFLINNRNQLKKILIEKPWLFDHGFVVKPNNKTQGKGVYVLAPYEKIPRINGPELLEQRIIPDLEGRKYWDVRVFVVDGEFVGGIKRETVHRVTNISKGAKAYPIGKRLLRKLKKPALEVVKTIDIEAGKIKQP